jgi:hypothetical protein
MLPRRRKDLEISLRIHIKCMLLAYFKAIKSSMRTEEDKNSRNITYSYLKKRWVLET